jgi:hypothetical protein
MLCIGADLLPVCLLLAYFERSLHLLVTQNGFLVQPDALLQVAIMPDCTLKDFEGQI